MKHPFCGRFRTVCPPLLFSVLLCMANAAPSLAKGATVVRGWIEESQKGGVHNFAVMAEAGEDAHIRYELEARHSGASGKSTTSQSGQAQLKPGVPQRLSSMSLNIANRDAYCVKLLIYSNNMVVAKDQKSPAEGKGCTK